MKDTSPAGHTIRFRRWSRKTYAAFASIGRCVTIGCLRKSVADSSLSKQKVAGNAGHAGCGEETPWKGETDGKENDIGIPPGSGTALTSLLIELQRNKPVLFEAQGVPHVNTWEGQYTYILKQERTRESKRKQVENKRGQEKTRQERTREDKRYGLPEAMQSTDKLHRHGSPYLCLYPRNSSRNSFKPTNLIQERYDHTETERTSAARQPHQ